jgi:hypothetical protein
MKVSATEGVHRSPADELVERAANPSGSNHGIQKQLEVTTEALIAADSAFVQEAIASAQWERRGVLQRLTRTDQPVARPTTSSDAARNRRAWLPARAAADYRR